MTEIHPQYIQAPGGELVVLTRAEFDALMARPAAVDEDEADVALFAERMADLAGGRDERLPAEVSALMLGGDSLLRALRKWRGKTQADLSRATSLTQGYISEIESGSKAGTFNALWAVAKALDVPEAWVIPEGLKQGPNETKRR